MTLTEDHLEKLDNLFCNIRWILDPDLQLTISDKADAVRRLTLFPDFAEILTDTDALNQEIIHPWLESRKTKSLSGWMGSINVGDNDPGTV
jgi:hypothetical protein